MLLILTTTRRLLIALFLFLAWTPAAYAWSWPVQGPVLRQFSYDEAHPYAAGQHRGIDIGADADGESVVAPAAGTVSFAGTVPTNGKSITIETSDGYSITLTHLGTILVAKGAALAERDPVATIGPSGTPEVDGPYVHLGIRHTADANGYVDPLTLLPPATQTGASDSGSTVSEPSTSGSSVTTTVTEPAPVAVASTPVATTRGPTVHANRSHASSQKDGRSREPRANAQPERSSERPAAHPASSDRRNDRPARVPHRRPSEPTRSSQRPVVEAVAHEPTVLDAGHEIRPSAPLPATPTPGVLVPLICNGAAALVALAAAFAATYRRRRTAQCHGEGARVLRLPARRVMRRAA